MPSEICFRFPVSILEKATADGFVSHVLRATRIRHSQKFWKAVEVERSYLTHIEPWPLFVLRFSNTKFTSIHNFNPLSRILTYFPICYVTRSPASLQAFWYLAGLVSYDWWLTLLPCIRDVLHWNSQKTNYAWGSTIPNTLVTCANHPMSSVLEGKSFASEMGGLSITMHASNWVWPHSGHK